MNAFRHPDKPGLSSPGAIPAWIDECDWLCQAKFDGWRCEILWRRGEPVRLTSRQGNPIPASAAARASLERALEAAPADGLRLDAEWMSSRRSFSGEERFHVFDLLERPGAAYWDSRADLRFATLGCYVPPELIVPHARAGFEDFFERLREKPGAEGVVLKRKTSKFIGADRKSANNPDWIKVKWPRNDEGALPEAA